MTHGAGCLSGSRSDRVWLKRSMEPGEVGLCLPIWNTCTVYILIVYILSIAIYNIGTALMRGLVTPRSESGTQP